MTSRVSFLNLVKETLRRHLAAVLITALVFFIHVINFFIKVQNVLNVKIALDTMEGSMRAQEMDYILKDLAKITLPSLGNAILAMLIGVYLAFDFFKYMHSKKETDFYESMPIKRNKWFFTLLTSSIGIYLVFSAVAIGIEFGIISAFGFGSGAFAGNLFWNFLCMLGAFLAVYVTTVLAMIMTGHSIIAFLGLGVFVSYIPIIIAYLMPVYAQVFFKTFVFEEPSVSFYYFSPVTLIYKAAYNWNTWNLKEHWTFLLGCFVFALLIGIVAYFLFKQRPSEAAGRAMAFEKINSGIRFLITVPLTLYIGLAFHEMVSFASGAWHIFGILFGGFLVHGIIECIFQFDIKALLSKKGQLLLTFALCLGFVVIFWTDAFHYDDYLPKAEAVESVSFESWLLNEREITWEKLQDGIRGDAVKDALTVVKDLRESSKDKGKREYLDNFTVIYQLKNGAVRKRSYEFYGDTIPKSLDKLSATEEFKNDFCIFYHMDKINISALSVSNGVKSTELKMSSDEMAEFCELYRKELEKQPLSSTLENQTVFELRVDFSLNDYSRVYSERYRIYDNFTETLSYLEKRNIKNFSEDENIIIENMHTYNGKYSTINEGYVEDLELLRQLKEHVVPGEFERRVNMDTYIHCEIRYQLDGKTEYTYAYIEEDVFQKIVDK